MLIPCNTLSVCRADWSYCIRYSNCLQLCVHTNPMISWPCFESHRTSMWHYHEYSSLATQPNAVDREMRVEAPTRKMVACPTHVPLETSTQCSLSFRMSPACKITNVTPKLHSTLRNTFQANASSLWVPECAWMPKFMMAPSLSIG